MLCLLGFAASFYIICEDYRLANPREEGEEAIAEEYEDLWMSLVKSYEIVFAGFAITDVSNPLGGAHKYVRFVFAGLLVVFTVAVNIIMLNLLIAIMGDTYDKISENSKAHLDFARAEIVLEHEARLPRDKIRESEEKSESSSSCSGRFLYFLKQLWKWLWRFMCCWKQLGPFKYFFKINTDEWFPMWLQVLVPSLESNERLDGQGWTGRVRALKNSVRKVEKKLEDSEKARGEETLHLTKKFEASEKKLEEVLAFLEKNFKGDK